jgi:hypothetical protein
MGASCCPVRDLLATLRAIFQGHRRNRWVCDRLAKGIADPHMKSPLSLGRLAANLSGGEDHWLVRPQYGLHTAATPRAACWHWIIAGRDRLRVGPGALSIVLGMYCNCGTGRPRDSVGLFWLSLAIHRVPREPLRRLSATNRPVWYSLGTVG